MQQPPKGRVETVSGAPDAQDAADVVAMLEESGAVPAGEGPSRLLEVRCLLRDDRGALAGASWAHADDVPLLGGRRLWMYRSVLAGGFEECAPALIAHTFEALERDFDPDGDGPIGLCVVVHDPAEMQRRPEAVWKDPHMVYVGYQPDGGQVRAGYFADAMV